LIYVNLHNALILREKSPGKRSKPAGASQSEGVGASTGEPHQESHDNRDNAAAQHLFRSRMKKPPLASIIAGFPSFLGTIRHPE
jgi:hypothetical protein